MSKLAQTVVYTVLCLVMFGCSNGDTDHVRFLEKDSYFQPEFKVITDQETGCEYLLVRGQIAPMPHTCNVDRMAGGSK